MTRSSRAPVVVMAALVLASCASSAATDVRPLTGGEALVVAGASDLRPAFEEIAALYAQQTGTEVVFDFGSSGQLAQRIIEGAPVDVFASADVGFVDAVLESGRGDVDTKATYALGRITIWSLPDFWGGWETLRDVVADTEVAVVAIANPEHAPYGRAAQQALESSDLWEEVEPRLVFGENIADTQRLAATGNADVAVVALSLAIAAGDEGTWAPIDDRLHEPLEQALLVTAEDPHRLAEAAGFIDFVNGTEGREVMRRYGFLLPGEQPSD